MVSLFYLQYSNEYTWSPVSLVYWEDHTLVWPSFYSGLFPHFGELLEYQAYLYSNEDTKFIHKLNLSNLDYLPFCIIEK